VNTILSGVYTERKVERQRAGPGFLIVNLGVPRTCSYQINQCSRGTVQKNELERYTVPDFADNYFFFISNLSVCFLILYMNILCIAHFNWKHWKL